MAYTPVDIITITPGNYTPGAQSTLDAMADVINAAWNQANIKYDAFETKMGDISTDWLGTAVAPHIPAASATAPTVAEPTITIADAAASTVLDTFETAYGDLIVVLSNKYVDFLSTYFPTEASSYGAAEAYVTAAITNTTASALPTAIVSQIWNDDKARIIADSNRAVAEVTDQWAAKRHPLPAGAMAYQTMQIQQKAQEEIAKSARAAAIKNWDTTYDKIMSSVKLALSNRTSAVQAAGDYIKALASGPDVASRIVGTGYDAQQKMISAAAQFYGARTNAAELAFKASATNAGFDQDAAIKNQASDITLVEHRLKALLTEAQGIAQATTALFNNVQASAGSRYNVSS